MHWEEIDSSKKNILHSWLTIVFILVQVRENLERLSNILYSSEGTGEGAGDWSTTTTVKKLPD